MAPSPPTLPRLWDTAAAAIAACARALGDPRTVEELHAASGLALRLPVDARLSPGALHRYPWREELGCAVERLGYRYDLVARGAGEPGFAQAREEAFVLAGEAPALLFGVHLAEFGVCSGSDGDDLLVSGLLDGTASPRLPRAAIGAGGPVFAMRLGERLAVDPAEAARATLADACARHRGAASAPSGIATGAAIYAVAQAALASGAVDPSGLALFAQRAAEGRSAFAGHLPRMAAALPAEGREELAAATAAMRRAAAMLGELASLCPFPPPAGRPLTTTIREQAGELVAVAAEAEAEAMAAIERALAGERARAAAAGLRIEPLEGSNLDELFTCINSIPLASLDTDARDCRARIAPSLGAAIAGRMLFRERALIGHILWAPLEEARYPVAASGRRWLVFCPWLEPGERGRGLGAKLFGALDQAARAAGVDGLLTLATSLEVFLHHSGYERHGFVEVDRRGDTRLLERKIVDAPSEARLIDPPDPPRRGALPVVVRHGYNCPLLLRARRDAAAAARSLGAQVALDEADAAKGEAAGVTVGGKAIAHGPLPAQALAPAFAAEAEDWP